MASDFGRHALHAGLEKPANGLYQFADKITGDRLPNWQLAPLEISSASDTAGETVGSAGFFLAASLATRAAMKKAGLARLAGKCIWGQAALASAEAGTAGAIVGLAHPVSNDNYWTEKLKVTGRTSVSFAAMGGFNKLLGSSSVFGEAGQRTLLQNVSLNTLAGAGGGVVDAFVDAGINKNRLPTLGEVGKSAGTFAAFGATFGGLEWGAPHAVRGVKTAWEYTAGSFRSPSQNLRASLAMSTELSAVAREAAPLNQATAERPLPKFSEFKEPVRASNEAPSPAAIKQSQQYVETGMIAEQFENGVRLPVSTTSRGFNAEGLPLSSAEKFLVIDKAKDPVLKAALADAKERFGHISDPHLLGTETSSYVKKLFNRYNLDGPALEQAYEHVLRRNRDKLIPLGEFVRNGSGVCLPRAALLKCINEELGLQLRLREGYLGARFAQPHVWTDRPHSSGATIYDPSQPNTQGPYTTPKSRGF